jgi:hypothetical protein
MRAWRAAGGAGALVVLVARLAIPAAPPMYEGFTPTQPYAYCSPPANLASSNVKPTSGGASLPAAGGSSQLGSQNTTDNQLLTFFPKGALVADGATSFKITLQPNCAPPAPPAGNKIVGDAYDFVVRGEPGDLAVKFTAQAQVLMRTPPVAYTSVQIYYDNAWHSTTWGQQGEVANITVEHDGTVAALDDGSSNPKGKPTPSSGGVVTIVEIILLAAAIGIVGAAIVVQRRRASLEKTTARGAVKGLDARAKGRRSKKK